MYFDIFNNTCFVMIPVFEMEQAELLVFFSTTENKLIFYLIY